ncbi:isochorismatase family protein [Streptomyces sp. FH025]|uniref:isochorismatase family protein n=1 Tax=Streptomyces sp. FH025 TaxID=2815937 RepID=UPI001A9ED9A1|nr:isochorismatase family protein [Streptomyces sp. FH025]MBO1413636.1 isochorismatase family protein [Streptomyces sp. FH025]
MPGIPPIQPYSMPTEGRLPRNSVDWQPDPRRAVLLLHDMQEYFLKPFPRTTELGRALVDNTARLRARAKELDIPVAYTAQPGGMTPEQRGLLKDFWGPGMQATPEHRQVVAPLEPDDGDWTFTKWRYSAFFKTDLLARMRERHRDQLIICGVYAHVGVLMTAVEAYTNDIQPFVVADAVADFSAQYHQLALTYAAERAAKVVTAQAVLTGLNAATTATH